jgi:hypothetical protein
MKPYNPTRYATPWSIHNGPTAADTILTVYDRAACYYPDRETAERALDRLVKDYPHIRPWYKIVRVTFRKG